ncbi:hypothetical protein [Kitasatospora viridis]|uniref:Tyr recombinase domain-containing protein n=1 Tax=Kitasatospora viridis TaxID=281105 RepID=A0A561SA54_9ACTN|nr:hypothetical protein [Kitasatospora viridis]TWF71752.1 hypothetical protein FHX73_18123 [Kitasatospora viridis]
MTATEIVDAELVDEQPPEAPPLRGTSLVVADGRAGTRPGLSDAARRRLEQSTPEETRRAYQREWNRFFAWCWKNAVRPLPCTDDDLSNWVAERCDSSDGISAIRQGIGAVVMAHETRYGVGKGPKTKESWRILSSYKRERFDAGHRADQAATFNADQLREMLLTIPNDHPAGVRDRALLCTMVASMNRRKAWNSLDIEDVTEDELDPESADQELLADLRAFVGRSKTDQAARGRTVVIPPGEHELSDPVGNLQAWLCEMGVQGVTTGPLWRPFSRGGRILDRRLNTDHARLLVRDAAARAGLKAPHGRTFKAHSTRASAVRIARKAGKTWSSIEEQGGWVPGSTAAKGYDRPEEEENAMRGAGL